MGSGDALRSYSCSIYLDRPRNVCNGDNFLIFPCFPFSGFFSCFLRINRTGFQVEKYRNYDFGTCPRFHCNKQRCLPVGESDTPRSRTVKIYCPKCQDLYAPESKHQESILSLVSTNAISYNFCTNNCCFHLTLAFGCFQNQSFI